MSNRVPFIVALRILALCIDFILIECVLLLLVKILPFLIKSDIAIAFFAAIFTVLFTFVFDRFQNYVDKHKSRYDDLVFLERELIMSLTVIDDNIFTLEPFMDEPISVYIIKTNPDKIEIDKKLINHARNLLLVNQLMELLIDYRKSNSSIETVCKAYNQGTGFIKTTEEIVKMNKYYRDKYIRDVIAHLQHLMNKTERAISLVVAVRDYAFPNIFKYLFWFITDWILDIYKSYFGLFLCTNYIDDESLRNKAQIKYSELKKAQAKNIREREEEIESIKSSLSEKPK